MLKHTSVGSSTPQVRNPTSLRKFKISEAVASLVEPLPFTSQLIKDTSKVIIERHQFYTWKRPSNLRSHWLVLTDTSPAIMVDTRNSTSTWSLKFPYDTRQIQKVGTVICEAAWSPQDATLWIWDIVRWENKDLWSTVPYSKRWDLLQTQLRPMIYENHPICDINIKYPNWMSLNQTLQEIEEPGYSIDFQPEKSGQRRFVWLIPKKADTFHPENFHERKMVSQTTCAIIPDDIPAPIIEEPAVIVNHDSYNRAILTKDKLSKLPDTYKLTSESGKDLGLAAIRSMEISTQIRAAIARVPECKVEIRWYDSFQKYEVKKIL